MRLSSRPFAGLLVVGLMASVFAAGPAQQGADFDLALAIGESATVESGQVAGINGGHFAGTDETYPCPTAPTPAEYCQTIFVQVTNPYEEENAKKSRERAALDLALELSGLGDAALHVYESDADGTRGDEVAGSDGLGETSEATSVAVTTAEGDEVRYYIVEVFFHAYAGSWSMDVSFN